MRTGAFGGMNRNPAVIIQREQGSVAQLQRLINQRLRQFARGRTAAGLLFQDTRDNFDIMLAETIQPQPFAGGMDFPVGPHFGVAVLGCPFRHFGVEAFAVFYHRREQQQIAARGHPVQQPLSQLIARLRLHGHLAIGTELRAQPREQQPHEMMDFRDRGDRAFAAAARVALLDADRRRDAGDQIDFGPRQLFHKLAGVGAHRVEKPALSLCKEQIKRQRAFARSADAGDDHKFPPGNRDGKILEVVLPRTVDDDGVVSGDSDVRRYGSQACSKFDESA